MQLKNVGKDVYVIETAVDNRGNILIYERKTPSKMDVSVCSDFESLKRYLKAQLGQVC